MLHKRLITKLIRIISIVLCLFLLCDCTVVFKDNHDEIRNALALNEHNNIYYYNQLNEEEKEYYILLYEASLEYRNYIEGFFTYNDQAFKKALKAFTYDWPEYYWWKEGFHVDYSSFHFESISNNGNFENYERYISEFNYEAKQILNECISNSKYETIRNIHDYLVNNITYSIDADNVHNIIGPLLNKVCVCDGYSLAFKYLCNMANIECIYVEGNSSSDNELASHAWNIVELDSNYYMVDVTWDDPQFINSDMNLVLHDFFLVNDEIMKLEHFPNEEFNYPKCNDESMIYYDNQGVYLKEFKKNLIRESLLNFLYADSQSYSLRFTDLQDKYYAYDWLINDKEFVDIYKQVNPYAYSFEYGCDYNDTSYVLHIFVY